MRAFVVLSLLWMVLPLQTTALTLATRISDKSTVVEGGDRLYFEVEIKYPENKRRQDLRVRYKILEKDTVIAEEEVLRAVETQASFLDYIVVPESIGSGVHTLTVTLATYQDIADGGFDETISASFTVLRGADKVTTYFFILLGAVLLVGVLISMQVFILLRRRTQ